MKLAYLVSEYPAVSHTFISREIGVLRGLGFEVMPVTIRPCSRPDALSPADKEAFATTPVLKQSLLSQGVPLLIKLVLKHPGNALALLRLAVQLNREGTRDWTKTAAYILEALRLREFLKANDLHHIHVHFGNVGARVAALACVDKAFSYSLSIHGPDDFYELSDNALHVTAARARFVRAISHFCRSQLLRILPFSMWDKVKIVHCGIPVQAFQPSADTDNLGALEIVCIGRLCAAKAQAILLDAAAKLKTAEETFRVTFVGDGPEADALHAYAQTLGLTTDDVRWTGAVPSDQVRACLAQAAIFCLPSFAEGVPTVLMEAMAMERPVISTVIMGTPELVQSGVNGLLVPPGDTAALADALKSLLHDPEARRAFGQAGRKTVLAHFDAETSGEAMAALFKTYANAE